MDNLLEPDPCIHASGKALAVSCPFNSWKQASNSTDSQIKQIMLTPFSFSLVKNESHPEPCCLQSSIHHLLEGVGCLPHHRQSESAQNHMRLVTQANKKKATEHSRILFIGLMGTKIFSSELNNGPRKVDQLDGRVRQLFHQPCSTQNACGLSAAKGLTSIRYQQASKPFTS